MPTKGRRIGDPPLDRNADGWANTGTIRIRTGWFGFAIAEEQYESGDGSREWRRLFMPTVIAERRTDVLRRSAPDVSPNQNQGG